MSTKYTPGPWAVQRTDTDFGPIFKIRYHLRTDDIAELYADSDDGNAKLIAAAPEMAEALHGALETLCEIERASLPGETRTIVERQITSTRAALAKAGL